MDRFDGRTALVTGGSRGIGRAICLRLAESGARVAINYARDGTAAAAVRDHITDAGGAAVTIQADVSDAGQVEGMVKETVDSLGPVDLLVCNAGIGGQGADLSHANWRAVQSINVDGTFLPIMAVKDGMIARQYGRIVCIASIAGLRPRPNNVAYATSKATVIAFVRNLAPVLAPHVRLNAVAPGLIETDMIVAMDQERRARMIAETPLQRIGEPAEIAEMAHFLLSERSSYTTGQTLVAGGGRVTVP